MRCEVHDCDYRENSRSTEVPGPTCSWDGSLHPDVFMDLCESGEAILTPTDKNYKVYIEVDIEDGADQLRIVSRADFNPGASPVYGEYQQIKDVDLSNVDTGGWMTLDPESWIQLAPVGNRRHSKFYFEHLSDAQKLRFIELLNEKKLRLEYPGYFYRLPFFVRY